jgi:iron complex transport system substrate-binding protein
MQAVAASVTDDRGRALELDRAPQRIVALAPHLAEIAFAVGAGARLVGVSSYSDYPEEAKRIPVVANNGRFDLERILRAKPDLALAWVSGNPALEVERLERRGIPVFATEARRLADIPRVLRLVGGALGLEAQAARAAHDAQGRIDSLAARYQRRGALKVFVEVWYQPLMTVNGAHLISDALRLCGGQNVFADAPMLTPSVSREALLAARAQVVIMSTGAGSEGEQAARWRAAAGALPAVRSGALYAIDPGLLHRQGPRVLDAAQRVCEKLDLARKALRR